MAKIYLSLTLFFLTISTAFGQLQSTNHKIIDNIVRKTYDLSHLKRSAQNPTACSLDTSEYPRYKGTGFYTVSVSSGRALGQLYSAPKPVTVYGFSFYAFVAANPPSPKKMKLICNLYKAGLDSLPSGSPLRSDTITIDSTFGGGVLTKIEKHATFRKPITMDSAYILTVETDSSNMNAGIVTNNYNNGDGRKENLNCGSISWQWYNGKNLNIGGVPFNADILLHPHVKYSLGADYTIKNNCYNVADTVKFLNLSGKNMSGSKMYNYYMLYNLGYYCNWWNTGDNFGYTWTVDHKVKYAQKQNYKIELISWVYPYRSAGDRCSDTTVRWLYYKPDVPQISGPGNACMGDSAKYTIANADTGAVYEWFKKTTDPSPFFRGKTYVKYNLTKSDTFSVRANNHGCVSSFRTVQLNVNAYPGNITFKHDSICAGSKANLKGSGDVGNVEWYTGATGGPLIYTGSTYQTPVLSKDTFFYFQVNNKGCIKQPRTKVNAYVGSNFAPASPTVSADTTLCLGATSIFAINASAGSGLTVRWFDAGSGGSAIATGNTYYFAPSKREVKTFYADAYNGVCGSTREPVNITVEDYPRIAKLMHDTICKGTDSAILSFNIPFGEAKWYDNATAGNLMYTGNRYALLPSSTQTLYIETGSGICKSPSRTPITALVNTYPTVVKAWGDTICAKNKATLKSTLTGSGTMHWYDDDTSNIALGIGKTYKTAVLNGSKTFYARPEYAGCYGPRQAVSPTVRPIPFSGFQYEIMTNQRLKVSPINSAGSTIKWFFGDGTTSTAANVTHTYANPGTYKVKLILTSTANGCQDSTIFTIDIQSSSIENIAAMKQVQVYPNPNNGVFNVVLANAGGNMPYRVMSRDGKVVMEQMALSDRDGFTIDMAHLSTGIYILQIAGYQPVMIVKN